MKKTLFIIAASFLYISFYAQKQDTLQVKNVIVKAQDKGALDYTIRARIETAVKRAQ